MKVNKHRHNNENQSKKKCNRLSTYVKSKHIVKCNYFDGDGVNSFDSECMKPWSSSCRDGNIHNCLKLKLKWFASLSEKNKKKFSQWF